MPVSRRIPGQGLSLHVLDYSEDPGAPGPEAPAMLLVHGMRDLAFSMDVLARAFVDTYRVFSLDLRGHGDSDKPGLYALPHFVADVRAAVRELALERPVIVAHSFGGEVASQYAGIFPQELSRLVLIEGLGPPPFEGEGSELARREMARMSITRGDDIDPAGRPLPDLDAAVARLREAHPRLDDARARVLAGHGTEAHPAGGLRWKADPMLRTLFGSFGRDLVEERWGWIECPVLVVVGSESHTWWGRGRRTKPFGGERGYLPPEELARRLACFSAAERVACVEVEGAGHMIHFDAPDELIVRIRAFLPSAPTAPTDTHAG